MTRIRCWLRRCDERYLGMNTRFQARAACARQVDPTRVESRVESNRVVPADAAKEGATTGEEIAMIKVAREVDDGGVAMRMARDGNVTE